MTSPNHHDTRKLLQVIGQVDVFEDSTASDTTISVFTAEGDEYVVVARKIVKRLLRFAGEEIDIEFLGYVSHDSSSGLDVLNVVSFKPTAEEETKTAAEPASDYDRKPGPKKRKKAIVQELDDVDVNAEDFDQAEGFDTIIIHQDDLTGLPLDDDDDPPLDDDDLDLDDDDLDLSVLDAIVRETLGKDTAAAETARAAEPVTGPTEKPSAAAKKIPIRRHAQDKTAPTPDAAPVQSRQTKKTGKEASVKRDKTPAAMTPKAARQSPTSGKPPVPKTIKAVEPKTPARSKAKKDTIAMAPTEPARKQKTPPPPPPPKDIPGQAPKATKTPRKPDSAKHAPALPAPAPKKKSPPPPAKQVPNQVPKKAAAMPTSKKVPGGAPKATRPQNANRTVTAKNQPQAATTKASKPVVPAAPKTVPKSSGPARSRKRQS